MSIFTDMFKPKRQREQSAAIEISGTFNRFSGTAYNNTTFRAAVDAIGRHAGKLTAHCEENKALETLLRTAPNPYMSGYDLLYKVVTTYMTHNNAFILVVRDASGSVAELYPVTPSGVEFVPGGDGVLYVKLSFGDGREAMTAYGDLVHLRRHFHTGDLMGNDNLPLYDILDTAQTINQGISASVKNGTSLRGVLKFTSLLNPEQVKAEKAKFVADYFNPGNSGGLAATDMRYEFQPANNTAYSIPREQIEAVNKQIYDYLGISEKIVSGEYSEDAFSAFHESTIEPFALQMSLEFSRKCGAEIGFTSERLEYSSAQTKIKLLHEAAPLGLMTINEARKLLALPPVDDGDKRLQSLNYVQADKAAAYQEIEGTESEVE
jgi:HK97 family phage portal protein